jgi:amidase
MSIDELLDRHDALGLAALIRDRQVTPTELLDAVAARIEARNPVVNAVVSRRFDEARAELDRGGLPDGPLSGVPVLVKDMGCRVAGLPGTSGSRLFADAVDTADGQLATRYRRAGLVIVGKTNTPEFGKSSSTEPVLHGPTRNPWRTTHSAGGSSGGSAAAVAAGMVPAAHANDGGGSTRIPAANCGLFGLKPSRGRVPTDDGRGAFAYPFTASHAVTRTVRDSAALLDAVAGPVPGDPYAALNAPAEGSFLAALGRAPDRLRIGVAFGTPDGTTAHPGARAAVERVAARLAELGHHVEEAAPTWDTTAARTAGSIVMAAAVDAQIQDRLAQLGRTLADDDIEPFTRVLHEMTAKLSAIDMHRALRHIEGIGREIAPFFDAYDVWLTPTQPGPVARLGLLDTTNPQSMFEHASATVAFTQVFNITGLPAASVPAGFDTDGLPIGAHLAARMGGESLLLRLAAQLEESDPWPWQAPWPSCDKDGVRPGS